MAKQPEKKTKRPTALKRDLQNEKKRLTNRVYKSRTRTAIRAFDDALANNDEALVTEKLNDIYSLLDKCVKTGVYKLNKASRTKSRLAARAVAKK